MWWNNGMVNSLTGESADAGFSTRSNTGAIRIAVNPCVAPTSAIKTTDSSNGAKYGRT
jgi:hypothetical protein